MTIFRTWYIYTCTWYISRSMSYVYSHLNPPSVLGHAVTSWQLCVVAVHLLIPISKWVLIPCITCWRDHIHCCRYTEMSPTQSDILAWSQNHSHHYLQNIWNKLDIHHCMHTCHIHWLKQSYWYFLYVYIIMLAAPTISMSMHVLYHYRIPTSLYISYATGMLWLHSLSNKLSW